MEAIITIVGFLGAGKTTLLKYLMEKYINKGWQPFLVLNDYENANIDAQQFIKQLDVKNIKALSGSCICCSGIVELRNIVNKIPERKNGITLIEANGTSDACALMEFLGVGINERYLPPIQVSVVAIKNWQKRGELNELEANQIQISSLIVLTHLEKSDENRRKIVIEDIKKLNPFAKIVTLDDVDIELLPELSPSENKVKKIEHQKTHWASCSVDLPNLPNINSIEEICSNIPESILRVKGCAKIGNEDKYTYFERNPDGKIFTRPFNGVPITDAKLLTIGPGSNPEILEKVIELSLNKNRILNK
jgi:G3E family GTPase